MKFDVKLSMGSEFNVDLGQIIKVGTADAYTGEYDVTPKISTETELKTKDKLMSDNVRIHKVPQYEVSNLSGGNTLIIGDEYYG